MSSAHKYYDASACLDRFCRWMGTWMELNEKLRIFLGVQGTMPSRLFFFFN